jgi:hypothetical protein
MAADRRALIVGTMLIVPLALASKGIPTARRWQAAFVDSVRARVDERQRGNNAVRALPKLRAALVAQRSAAEEIGAPLSDSTSPAVAAAMLASLIDSMAAEAGVRVTSLELSADTTRRAAVVPIRVRLTGACDVAGLMALMQSIESARAPVAVRELSVAAADPASSEMRPEVLHLDAVVESIAGRASVNARGAP